MSTVEKDITGNITVLILNHGITNPINPQVIKDLIQELDDISTNGLIITSANNKFFSIGFDLPRLLELDRKGFEKFYQAFNELCLKLFSLPIPTLTAIPGHCIAAGCIIAACTDFRFMVNTKAKLGVTAVKLGLPVPYLSERIVQQVLDNEVANKLLSTGELYDVNWAKDVAYTNELLEPDELYGKSKQFLERFINQSGDKFAQEKITKTKPIIQSYLDNKTTDEENFVNTWFSSAIQERLREATKKF
jgi:enoyl-CoA hydratase/carnithine racemase